MMPRLRLPLLCLFALGALLRGVPAYPQSVAETNLVNSLVNSADGYMKQDKILLALDAIVQAEKLKVPSDRINETLALVLKRRKEMADERLQKARMYLNDNDAKKAIAFLKEVLDFWPDNEEVIKKLAALGVQVKDLNIKAQRYQKTDFNLLDDLKLQIRNVDQALKALAEFEARRAIKEALDAAEEYCRKLENHPALELKRQFYRSAWAALQEYDRARDAFRTKSYPACAQAGGRAEALDPTLRYGFLGLEKEELALRLLFAGIAAATAGPDTLAVTLERRLEELGQGGPAAYVKAVAEYGRGRNGEALRLLQTARMLSSPAQLKEMEAGRLLASAFLLHYRSLLVAMALQVLVFGFLAVRTFLLADLIVDHELTRRLFMQEREIGYYISRCQSLIARNKWRKAERLAHYVHRRNPNIPQVQLWIGICRYRLGDKRAAMKIVGDFLKGAPRHPEAHYYMGLLMDDSNRPKEALQHLELARGISGATRNFNMDDVSHKGEFYFEKFKEYKEAAAMVLGIKL